MRGCPMCGKQTKISSFSKWEVNVTFVPFESERQRDMAYDVWIEAWVRGEKNRLAKESLDKSPGSDKI